MTKLSVNSSELLDSIIFEYELTEEDFNEILDEIE